MAYKQSKDISGLMMKMKSPLNYGGESTMKKSAMMKTGDPEKELKGTVLPEVEVTAKNEKDKKVKYDATDERVRKDRFKQKFYDTYKMPISDVPEMFKREYQKSIEGSWKIGDVKED